MKTSPRGTHRLSAQEHAERPRHAGSRLRLVCKPDGGETAEFEFAKPVRYPLKKPRRTHHHRSSAVVELAKLRWLMEHAGILLSSMPCHRTSISWNGISARAFIDRWTSAEKARLKKTKTRNDVMTSVGEPTQARAGERQAGRAAGRRVAQNFVVFRC